MSIGREMLSEPEIVLACQFGGSPSNFDEPYEEIGEGSELTLWSEEAGDFSDDKRAFRVRILALKSGKVALEGVEGSPPSKVFEAEVLRTTDVHFEKTSKELGWKNQVFGVLFPNGFASFMDTAPDSDYADRTIRAAIILAEGESESAK